MFDKLKTYTKNFRNKALRDLVIKMGAYPLSGDIINICRDVNFLKFQKNVRPDDAYNKIICVPKNSKWIVLECKWSLHNDTYIPYIGLQTDGYMKLMSFGSHTASLQIIEVMWTLGTPGSGGLTYRPEHIAMIALLNMCCNSIVEQIITAT